MSPETFEAAVSRTKMRGATVDAARQVLVYGTTAAQAAELHGRTGAWARQAVARVRSAARRDVLLCPDGWEVVTVCVPPETVDLVREMEREERERLAD